MLGGFLYAVSRTRLSAVIECKRMARRSAEFAPVLPAVCGHRDISPGDIVSTPAALRVKRLRPLGLMPWNLAAERNKLSHSHLAPLLDALVNHGREGFPVAVHLICTYVGDTPDKIDGLSSQVARIAGGVKRWEHTEEDAMTEDRFERLMTSILKRGRQDSMARALALTLADAFVESLGTGNARLVEPLLPRLLADFPEIAWPLIGQAAISETKPRWIVQAALGEKPSPETQAKPAILYLPLEALFAWCRAHPDSAPAFAAATVPLLESDEAGAPTHSLHPVMLRLIDEFGHRQDVLEAVSSNVGSFNRVTSASSVLHLYREPLMRLQNHIKRGVREWARAELRDLEILIEAATARNAQCWAGGEI